MKCTKTSLSAAPASAGQDIWHLLPLSTTYLSQHLLHSLHHAVSHFSVLEIPFPPLLLLTQTVLHLFALMWDSLWVNQWETAAYQTSRKSGQQQPHLPPLSPLWVHAPEMSEHPALNMSLCSLRVVYTSLSDVYVLGSKGSWLRSHCLVCHLALFDQKEAVKHQVKAHLLPLLTDTACLLLPWPPSSHINTLIHWVTGSAAAFTPNPSQPDVGYVIQKCFHMHTDSDHLIQMNYTETATNMSWC